MILNIFISSFCFGLLLFVRHLWKKLSNCQVCHFANLMSTIHKFSITFWVWCCWRHFFPLHLKSRWVVSAQKCRELEKESHTHPYSKEKAGQCANQWLFLNLSENWGNRTRHQRIHVIWSHLHDILEKPKLQRWKTNGWLPEGEVWRWGRLRRDCRGEVLGW